MTTSRLWPLLLAAVAVVGALPFGCGGERGETPTSGRVTVCVSESHLELFQEIAATFNGVYKEASVSALGATSREAIVNLINDSVKVIVTDRPLNAEEQAVVAREKIDLEEVAVAEDGLAVVVNRVNDAATFTVEGLRGIATGEVTDWGQIAGSGLSGPIELVLTGRNSGAYELLKDRFLSVPGDLAVGAVEPSQREVVDHVASRPQAVGVVSGACWRSPSLAPLTDVTAGAVKALAFSAVDSAGLPATHVFHQANIHLGRYPLHYPVYLYFRKESSLAAGFCAFVAGAHGQKMILDWGLVPATMPVRIVTLT
jgi:phosphate transport system substrate-binding protein